jgi:hypothetical protein
MFACSPLRASRHVQLPSVRCRPRRRCPVNCSQQLVTRHARFEQRTLRWSCTRGAMHAMSRVQDSRATPAAWSGATVNGATCTRRAFRWGPAPRFEWHSPAFHPTMQHATSCWPSRALRSGCGDWTPRDGYRLECRRRFRWDAKRHRSTSRAEQRSTWATPVSACCRLRLRRSATRWCPRSDDTRCVRSWYDLLAGCRRSRHC